MLFIFNRIYSLLSKKSVVFMQNKKQKNIYSFRKIYCIFLFFFLNNIVIAFRCRRFLFYVYFFIHKQILFIFTTIMYLLFIMNELII